MTQSSVFPTATAAQILCGPGGVEATRVTAAAHNFTALSLGIGSRACLFRLPRGDPFIHIRRQVLFNIDAKRRRRVDSVDSTN